MSEQSIVALIVAVIGGVAAVISALIIAAATRAKRRQKTQTRAKRRVNPARAGGEDWLRGAARALWIGILYFAAIYFGFIAISIAPEEPWASRAWLLAAFMWAGIAYWLQSKAK